MECQRDHYLWFARTQRQAYHFESFLRVWVHNLAVHSGATGRGLCVDAASKHTNVKSVPQHSQCVFAPRKLAYRDMPLSSTKIIRIEGVQGLYLPTRVSLGLRSCPLWLHEVMHVTYERYVFCGGGGVVYHGYVTIVGGEGVQGKCYICNKMGCETLPYQRTVGETHGRCQ